MGCLWFPMNKFILTFSIFSNNFNLIYKNSIITFPFLVSITLLSNLYLPDQFFPFLWIIITVGVYLCLSDVKGKSFSSCTLIFFFFLQIWPTNIVFFLQEPTFIVILLTPIYHCLNYIWLLLLVIVRKWFEQTQRLFG